MAKSKTVFVVHGRNLAARIELFAFLRSLGLVPLEWEQAVALTKKGAPSVKEIIEAGMASSQAVIVLMTGDDLAALSPHLSKSPEQFCVQPRQNVLFEAGLAFGLHPGSTILVQIEPLREISDLSGIHYLRLSDEPEDRTNLKSRLETAGCRVAKNSSDWLSTGCFSNCPRGDGPTAFYTGIERAELTSKAEPDYAHSFLSDSSELTIALFDGRVWFKRRHNKLLERMQLRHPLRVLLVNPDCDAALFRAKVIGKDPAHKKADTHQTIEYLTNLASACGAPLRIYYVSSYLPYTLLFNEKRMNLVMYTIFEKWQELPMIVCNSNSPIYQRITEDAWNEIRNKAPIKNHAWV